MESVEYSLVDKYAFTDPASGKGRLKKVRARQAIIVIGTDHLQRIFTLYAWAGRLPTSQYIKKLIKVCTDYSPRIFGVEANAMQTLFADVVIDEAKKTMATIPFAGIYQSTKVTKDFRIRSILEPVINNGRLFTQKRQDELNAEIRGFPSSATKDLVDCLASAIALMPKRTVVQQKNEEAEALATYLRATGAPSHYIEKRIKEIENEQSSMD